MVGDIDGLKSFYSSLKAFSGADFSKRYLISDQTTRNDSGLAQSHSTEKLLRVSF